MGVSPWWNMIISEYKPATLGCGDISKNEYMSQLPTGELDCLLTLIIPGLTPVASKFETRNFSNLNSKISAIDLYWQTYL